MGKGGIQGPTLRHPLSHRIEFIQSMVRGVERVVEIEKGRDGVEE